MPSSGMWRRVDMLLTDVTKERGVLSQQVMEASHMLPQEPPEHDARSTRLCWSMHARQLSPKAVGPTLSQ
jgi:hypothetical protein